MTSIRLPGRGQIVPGSITSKEAIPEIKQNFAKKIFDQDPNRNFLVRRNSKGEVRLTLRLADGKLLHHQPRVLETKGTLRLAMNGVSLTDGQKLPRRLRSTTPPMSYEEFNAFIKKAYAAAAPRQSVPGGPSVTVRRDPRTPVGGLRAPDAGRGAQSPVASMLPPDTYADLPVDPWAEYAQPVSTYSNEAPHSAEPYANAAQGSQRIPLDAYGDDDDRLELSEVGDVDVLV